MPYGFAGANNSSARWNGSISIFCKTCWFLFSEIFGGVTQGSSVLNMNVKLTTRADDLVCVALVWEVDGREASCEIRVCKKIPWTLVMICTSAELQLCNFGTTLRQLWENFETTWRQLWDNFLTTLRQLWENFEPPFRQLWDNFDTTFRQFWDNYKISMRQFWGKVAT